MKVVINRCYGGFSLSREAVKRMAELQGRPCYFFTPDMGSHRLDRYLPAPEAPIGRRDMFWTAFDIPNPNDILPQPDGATWAAMSMDERQASNARYAQHDLTNRPDDRADPLLVRVVEELGSERASGACAELSVVEIPDGIEYEIQEYDGIEHIAETHRTWR